MNTLLYETGNYGPIGLILLSWLLLWEHKTMFTYYNLGVLFNLILNVVLKSILQQPRPSVNPQQFESMKRHASHFFFQNGVPFHMLGMPSGHVQCASFSTMFLYLTLKDIKLLWLCLCFTIITAYQRVVYDFHTFYQVVAGFIVGILFAIFVYILATNKLKGIVLPKIDDASYFN